MQVPMNFNVILFKEDDAYVAQALEKDLCASGASIEEAMNELARIIHLRAIIGREEGKDLFAVLPKPPAELVNKFIRNAACPPRRSGSPSRLVCKRRVLTRRTAPITVWVAASAFARFCNGC